MKGGNETTNGSGVTQFAEGEPKKLNPTSGSPNGECVIPFASLTPLPPSNHSFIATYNVTTFVPSGTSSLTAEIVSAVLFCPELSN